VPLARLPEVLERLRRQSELAELERVEKHYARLAAQPGHPLAGIARQIVEQVSRVRGYIEHNSPRGVVADGLLELVKLDRRARKEWTRATHSRAAKRPRKKAPEHRRWIQTAIDKLKSQGFRGGAQLVERVRHEVNRRHGYTPSKSSVERILYKKITSKATLLK
jgi:hypothetical protein